MNNQVFLNCTFAEIYANTPWYMKGQDVAQFNAVYLATIEYCGKPADIAVVYDCQTDIHCMVLTDECGTIL